LADETSEVVLEVPSWPGHLAGQYLNVRLPSQDRWARPHSFSIATPPTATGEPAVQLRIAVRADLFAAVPVGATLQVEGPKGDRMAWRPESTGDRPLLLIGGGTGIVPLMSIVHAWTTQPQRARLQVIYSVRTLGRQLYADELARIGELPEAEVVTIVTRGEYGPERLGRGGGRLSAIDLEVFGLPPGSEPECFVCGPVSFVESVTRMLVQTKHPAVRIRTEWDVSLEEEDA